MPCLHMTRLCSKTKKIGLEEGVVEEGEEGERGERREREEREERREREKRGERERGTTPGLYVYRDHLMALYSGSFLTVLWD